MVVPVRLTIRVFLTFSDWWESNATKLSREKMWKYKNQNRRKKVLNRGFEFEQGVLTFRKFGKIFTDL